MEFINGYLEYPQVFRFKTLFKVLASKRKQILFTFGQLLRVFMPLNVNNDLKRL